MIFIGPRRSKSRYTSRVSLFLSPFKQNLNDEEFFLGASAAMNREGRRPPIMRIPSFLHEKQTGPSSGPDGLRRVISPRSIPTIMFITLSITTPLVMFRDDLSEERTESNPKRNQCYWWARLDRTSWPSQECDSSHGNLSNTVSR